MHVEVPFLCTFSWGLLELVAAPGLDWQQHRLNPPWSVRWPPSAPWHIDQDSLCLVHGGLDPERCLHRPRIWSYGWTQNRVFHFAKKKKRKKRKYISYWFFFPKDLSVKPLEQPRHRLFKWIASITDNCACNTTLLLLFFMTGYINHSNTRFFTKPVTLRTVNTTNRNILTLGIYRLSLCIC